MAKSAQIDVRQLSYKAEIATIAETLKGPALQIGSRTQVIDRKVKGRLTWRERLKHAEFTGADLEKGENVEAVFDVTWSLDLIEETLPNAKRFKTIICSHLLEHVTNPFQAARNISDLLEPGGVAFIQVPWVQAFHAFPDDFWRISFSGLQVLFDELEPVDAMYSGGSSDVCYRLLRGGKPALDKEALQHEADIFQIMLDQQSNIGLLKRLNSAAYLSRAYMPACVLTWLARKPE